jgi:predicted SnoaL-like aldol condensation-catalyzing enzyme
MTSKRKDQICTLLKGIETGDEASVAVVNPDKYIQHNPQTHEGGEGLAALFKRLSKSSPRAANGRTTTANSKAELKPLVQSSQKNRINTGAYKDDQVCYVYNTAPRYVPRRIQRLLDE